MEYYNTVTIFHFIHVASEIFIIMLMLNHDIYIFTSYYISTISIKHEQYLMCCLCMDNILNNTSSNCNIY